MHIHFLRNIYFPKQKVISTLQVISGEGNGNPLQYSCLEDPRDLGARWAAICGIAQSWTRLKQLSNLATYASKVMLKILQARLQQYVNHELPDVQAGFRKGRGTRDQTANIC